jgi:hypothetical protein
MPTICSCHALVMLWPYALDMLLPCPGKSLLTLWQTQSKHGKSMARAWQEHVKSMAKPWHGTSLAITWQEEQGKTLAMAWQEHGANMARSSPIPPPIPLPLPTRSPTPTTPTLRYLSSPCRGRPVKLLPTSARHVYAMGPNHLFHRSSSQPFPAPMSLLRSRSERCRALRGSKGKMYRTTTTSRQIPH